MKSSKKNMNRRIVAAAFCLSALFLSSCNEPKERLLQDSYPESGTGYETGHVLLVIIDGASGTAVNEAYNSRKAPNIRSMTDNSMFTFDGLAETNEQMNKERGWANLMTGVTTHDVGDAKGIDELQTPSFLKRLKESDADLKVSLYASDSRFFDAFGSDADVKKQTASDRETTDALLAETGEQTAKPSDVIVVQLGGVEKAGVENGFWKTQTVPTDEVIDAVYEVDALIGEMKKTLEARPNYGSENWIVVVTSGYGGNYNGSYETESLYDEPGLNTFSMIYNSRFSPSLLRKPSSSELQYKFCSPYFVGPGQRATTNAVMINNTKFFNMDKRWSSNTDDEVDTGGYTIHFRMIDLHNDPWGNRNILSKRYGTSGPGWQIRYSSNTIFEFYANNRSGNAWISRSTRRDGLWHSYTVVIKEVNNTQTGDSIILYLDGVRDAGCLTDGSKDMWTDAPLTIGHTYSPDRPSQANVIINDLQFYNIALPADFIAANHCKTQLDDLGEDYEYWNELVGYYPNDREDDRELPYLNDYSKYTSEDKRLYFNKPVGTFSPSDDVVTYMQRGVISENVCPLIDDSFYEAVFNTVDLPYQVFQWLGKPVDFSWGFEGKGWSLNYTSLNE
jgi:hypothetical protein